MPLSTSNEKKQYRGDILPWSSIQLLHSKLAEHPDTRGAPLNQHITE